MKFLIVAVCVTYYLCGTTVTSAALKDNGNDDVLAQSSLQFTWDAYKTLNVPSGENVFFSPYSIMNAMGMLVLGTDGQTEAQLMKALRVPTSLSSTNMHAGLSEENSKLQSETEATIGVANRFFVDKGSVSHVNPEYKANLKELYNSTLEPTPFAEDPSEAKTMINDFVDENTRGQIPNMLTENVKPNTKLMLVNAIYFKGDWTTRFNVDLTTPSPFHAKSGDVTAQLMKLKTSLPYAECPDDEKCQIVALPYTEKKKYKMFVIVPNEGQNLETLESGLDTEKIRNLMASVQPTSVEIHMPRFTMKNKLRLESVFDKLGASDVFGPRGSSDSKIFTSPGSQVVDEIIHEAKVEVNENGTVAAAATGISVTLSLDLNQKFVVLNRPFLFFITDSSNNFVLFWGRLENPSTESS